MCWAKTLSSSGRKADAGSPIPAREHVFLKCPGFETSAHPFLPIPLPDPSSLYSVSRKLKQEAGFLSRVQVPCVSGFPVQALPEWNAKNLVSDAPAEAGGSRWWATVAGAGPRHGPDRFGGLVLVREAGTFSQSRVSAVLVCGCTGALWFGRWCCTPCGWGRQSRS